MSFCEEVSYLGYTLCSEGVKPGEEKLDAVKNFPTPKNRHEIRRYLGLTGFFRRFIPRYAEITHPLSELLKSNVPFIWGESQDKSFILLKEKLLQKPVLKLYSPTAETELHYDASSAGLSGMLLQRDPGGLWGLVQAVSKKTTDPESRYHSGRLELMAIAWSAARLRHLLVGIKFVIVNDCQAIMHLNTQKTVNPQVARWANLLSEFDYEIKHRPGDKMAHVDALSRAPTGEAVDTVDELLENKLEVLTLMTEEEYVLPMQRSDPRLKSIIEILSREASSRSNEEQTMVKEYELINGLLYRTVCFGDTERSLWVVPQSMR